MTEKRISHCQGKGSLTHNNRRFNAKNVDSLRTKDNVVFVSQPISEAYEQLFGAAVERYNARQKRADRKITTSYFEHVFKRSPSQSVVTSADKRKSFYEDVVQIGTKDDTGVSTPDAEIAAACLTEYMQGFQERNPNFFVFNAVLHLDEATPHLHIDYIPVGHYKQGVDTQNGLAQALKEMNFGVGKDAIARWRESECKLLTEICNHHGVRIAAPEKSRGSLTVEQYKEYAQVRERVEDKKKEIVKLDKQLADNQTLLNESAGKVSQIRAIDSIETGKTIFGGKITVSREDYSKLTDLAKKQIAAENRESVLTAEAARLKKENEAAAERYAILERNARQIYPLKERLRVSENELGSLKAKFQRVMEFVEGLGLAQKLKEFLNPRRGMHR